MSARRSEATAVCTGCDSNCGRTSVGNARRSATAAHNAHASSELMGGDFWFGAGGPNVSGYTNTAKMANATNTATANWLCDFTTLIMRCEVCKFKTIRELLDARHEVNALLLRYYGLRIEQTARDAK